MTESLETICSYRNEKASAASITAEDLYVSTESMGSNRGGVSRTASVPSEGKVSCFRKGDTLVSNIRPYFKKIWNADIDGYCSNDVLVFQPSQRCSADYLYWLLCDDAFFDYVMATSKGTKMPRGDKSAIMSYAIPSNSEMAQRNIASILAPIQAKIEMNAKLNGYLEELVSLMFDRLIENRTETVPFSTYAKISSGKRPPIKSPNYTDECVFPLFGATSQMGYTSEYLTDEKLLVIGRVGTHGVVQRVNGKAWPSDNTLVIRSKHYETASQLLQRVDYSSLNRGSTQPLITQGDLKAYEVPFINTSSLERFENQSSRLMALYDYNCAESTKLAELRDTLLPRLMSGEIDVSEVPF